MGANYRFKIWMYDFMGTYSIAGSMDNALEILLGARYMRQKLDLDIALGPKWFISLRGDLGGFGIGSSFTYSLSALLGFRISRVIDIALGYRHLDIDYSNDKEGRELFKFDGYMTGFLVGLNFRL